MQVTAACPIVPCAFKGLLAMISLSPFGDKAFGPCSFSPHRGVPRKENNPSTKGPRLLSARGSWLSFLSRLLFMEMIETSQKGVRPP